MSEPAFFAASYKLDANLSSSFLSWAGEVGGVWQVICKAELKLVKSNNLKHVLKLSLVSMASATARSLGGSVWWGWRGGRRGQ
jgi:hypothetical protein